MLISVFLLPNEFLCVRASVLVRACQACVNRDERCRVRVWSCIIHEADLAEESLGSPVLL